MLGQEIQSEVQGVVILLHAISVLQRGTAMLQFSSTHLCCSSIALCLSSGITGSGLACLAKTCNCYWFQCFRLQALLLCAAALLVACHPSFKMKLLLSCCTHAAARLLLYLPAYRSLSKSLTAAYLVQTGSSAATEDRQMFDTAVV